MTDFAIACVCITVGYLARLAADAVSRRPEVLARLDAAEQRLDVIEEAVGVEDDGDDPEPDGGEELPENLPALRVVTGGKS